MVARKKTHDLSGPDRILQISMATLGALLLLGSFGVLLKNALGAQRPAYVEVIETGRTRVGDRTVVQIEAVNRGDRTAAAVTVEGAGPAAETASITLDYVPGRSRTAAALTFDGDVTGAPLTLRAAGWVDP